MYCRHIVCTYTENPRGTMSTLMEYRFNQAAVLQHVKEKKKKKRNPGDEQALVVSVKRFMANGDMGFLWVKNAILNKGVFCT